ncbi:MAG: peptide deformylase [Thermoguttaceae bacterium]
MYSIVKYPHPILRHKCKPIQKIDAKLKSIVDEMFEIMYSTEGIGLAANQIGLPYQLFIMNASGDREKTDEEYVFVNPIILKKKGREEDNEGCLSFPDIRADVVRPAEIVFEGVSLGGKVMQFNWKGLLARVVQHEIDHLFGKSFVDRISVASVADVREKLDDLLDQYETDQNLGLIGTDDAILAQIAELERLHC